MRYGRSCFVQEEGLDVMAMGGGEETSPKAGPRQKTEPKARPIQEAEGRTELSRAGPKAEPGQTEDRVNPKAGPARRLGRT